MPFHRHGLQREFEFEAQIASCRSSLVSQSVTMMYRAETLQVPSRGFLVGFLVFFVVLGVLFGVCFLVLLSLFELAEFPLFAKMTCALRTHGVSTRAKKMQVFEVASLSSAPLGRS